VKQHILITGGAGYIGSVLVSELLNDGYQVTVLDNFTHRQNSLGHVCHLPALSIVQGDVRSKDIVRPLVKKADVVIAMAALVGAPLCDRDPLAAQTVNQDAVLEILKMMSKTQWILIPTTNSGYGIGKKGVPCTEDSPMYPLSLYAKTKIEAEKALLERGNAISFRLATAFGMSPRMRVDLLVNDFVYRAVRDRFVVLFESHFKRNYIHVRDAARVLREGVPARVGEHAGEVVGLVGERGERRAHDGLGRLVDHRDEARPQDFQGHGVEGGRHGLARLRPVI